MNEYYPHREMPPSPIVPWTCPKIRQVAMTDANGYEVLVDRCRHEDFPGETCHCRNTEQYHEWLNLCRSMYGLPALKFPGERPNPSEEIHVVRSPSISNSVMLSKGSKGWVAPHKLPFHSYTERYSQEKPEKHNYVTLPVESVRTGSGPIRYAPDFEDKLAAVRNAIIVLASVGLGLYEIWKHIS